MKRGWLWIVVCVLFVAAGCGRNTRGSGGSILPPGGNGNNGGSDADNTSDSSNNTADGVSGGDEDGSSPGADGEVGDEDTTALDPDSGGGGEDIQTSDSSEEQDTSGPDCVEDNDCGSGFVCKNGKCLPDQPGCEDACTPATTKCTPDTSAYVTCVPLQDGCFGWGTDKIACPANTSCINGECKETAVVCPPTACLSQGAKQCSGNAVQTCQSSAANPGCNEWKTTENCGATATCSAGACIPNAGDGSCAEVFECLETNQCESLDDACSTGCAEESGTKGEAEFNAYVSCINTQCGAVETQAEFNYCMLSKCKTAGSKCFPDLGAGTDDCMAFYECTGGCADGDDACITACAEQLSWNGLADLWNFQSCAENFCEGLTGNDFANCALQYCYAQTEKCFQLAP
ncbi:MAG: hypothetical protein HUU55_02220 [Myxococcales bacterium]|nr:hypothetical protein [Myxococcales bacterium]